MSWKDLLDKLKQKLSLWTFRALNFRSTLILVNFVLQAMPLYLLSVLAAPKFVIKHVRNIQRKFLWGGDKIHRKWPLVDWKMVCKPKNVGGIGLQDPLDTNKAMGEKIWWKWITYEEEPRAKLWHTKYAHHWLKQMLT